MFSNICWAWAALFLLHPYMLLDSVAQNTQRQYFNTYINERGWKVPGTEEIKKRPVLRQREETINGIKIQITQIDPIRKLKGGFDAYTTMPDISISNETVYYRDHSVVALALTKYSFKGKAFCYLVSMATYSPSADPLFFGGAVAGDQFYCAFYDEYGYGLFQTREPANLLLGSPNYWHVRLPEWVK
jgi:hypothetical protein